jgi:hypothetical protein
LPASGGAASAGQLVHRNEFPNAAFEPYQRLKGNRTLKDSIIAADDRLPKDNWGHKMCLTFHLLVSCNSRCKHKKDHHNIEPNGRKHSVDEDTKLLAWCAQHIQAE